MTDDMTDGASALTFPDDERGTFGIKLFLIALGVLFAASMVGYATIRSRLGNVVSIHLPAALWWSTLAMILSGVSISRALASAKQGRSAQLRGMLLLALVLSLAFLAIQIPSAWQILREHAAYRAQDVYLYGLAFTLIGLHALHVLGGLVPLAVVTLKSQRNPNLYHSYHFGPVRYVTMYWHFLEVVWIVMFGLLLLLG